MKLNLTGKTIDVNNCVEITEAEILTLIYINTNNNFYADVMSEILDYLAFNSETDRIKETAELMTKKLEPTAIDFFKKLASNL